MAFSYLLLGSVSICDVEQSLVPWQTLKRDGVMKNCLTSVLFQVLLYKMRLNESRTRPFQAPVSIHSYPGGQVYVFPNGRSDSEESSEEELNVMELRPRGRERPCSTARGRAGDVVLLEREITEDDSLNKLALQYGCKVRAISVCFCVRYF